MADLEVRRVARISKRTVDTAKPEAARFTLWDSDLKGFGLRVAPSGTRTYVVRYRLDGGRSGALKQMVIGRHGALTPDEARDLAKSALAKVAGGEDPQAAKVKRREEMTVADLCELYMAEGVATKKATTLRIDRIRLDRHIKPRLGRMKITDVGRADIERLMQDVGSGKITSEATPHTRGGKGAASRTVGLLGGIFSFAVDRGFIEKNPTRGVKRFRDNRRDRFLSPAELGRLGDTLAARDAAGGDERHTAIIRLLALTGARKNEIARLRWSEIDYEYGVLRLADSKTGQKIVPLGAAALKILADTPPNESPYLFPDHRDPKEPIGNLDWAWVSIRTAAGLPDVRIHDLRHSFASVGLASGQGLAMLGKLLGHSDTKTTARYAHLADDPARAAADAISKSVAAAMGGSQGQ